MIKRMVVILIISAMAVTLFGCGAEESSAKALTEMLESMKTGQRDEIGKYYDFEENSGYVNVEDSNEALDAILSTLTRMEYKIKSTNKIDSDNVEFSVELKTIDAKRVMELYIDNVMAMVEDPEYQSQLETMEQEDYQKRLANQMTTALQSEDIGMATNEIKITMTRQDDNWTVADGTEELINILFGNLEDAVNSMV